MIINIAIATPEYPDSLKDGLDWVEKLVKEAAAKGAEIICFPESYLPGYPLPGYTPEACSRHQLQTALETVTEIAMASGVAIIIPMDWYEGEEFLNVAWVISGTGELLGYQSKNQLDPSEDVIWKAGNERRIFEVGPLKFGVVICHEGFRYPETVRWAAHHGAQVVFHPNLTGSRTGTRKPAEWGSKENPYYEKAQMMRALENTIYFAPSNYALPYSESASAIIDPDGNCIAYQSYDEPGVIVAPIDTDKATGLLASRFRPALYVYQGIEER